MEEEKEIKAVKPAKAPKGVYIALTGFDTSEGARYEIGDRVEGLKPIDLEALLQMGAIELEGK